MRNPLGMLVSVAGFRFWDFELRASGFGIVSNFGLRISQASAFVLLMLALSPSRAAAHLVSTGMGPVYDGIGHLLLTPEDLVPVLAIALYAGLRGLATGRRTMFLLPAAWFAGGLAGSFVSVFGYRVSDFASTPDTAPSLPIPAISFLILGGLVAADLWTPPPVVTGLAVSLGLVHGFLNGATLRDGTGILGLIGIMAMLFVLVTLTSAFVVTLGKPWARVAVRVVGSWIAAMGLLTFGWAMR